MRKGAILSDADIQAVTNPPAVERARAEGKRVYRAVYRNGDSIYLAVGSVEHARTYAVEYGMRFIGSRLHSCAWDRDSSDPVVTVPTTRGKGARMARASKAEIESTYEAMKAKIAGGMTINAAAQEIAESEGITPQTAANRYKSVAGERGEYEVKTRGTKAAPKPKATKDEGGKTGAKGAFDAHMRQARAEVRQAWESIDAAIQSEERTIKTAQAEIDRLNGERESIQAFAAALGLDLNADPDAAKTREPAEESA